MSDEKPTGRAPQTRRTKAGRQQQTADVVSTEEEKTAAAAPPETAAPESRKAQRTASGEPMADKAHEAAEDEVQEDVQEAEQTARARQPIGPYIVAGAVGGLVGAAVVFLLPAFLMPANDTAARLAVVERGIANGASRDDLAAIGARVTAVSSALDGLTSRVNGLSSQVEGQRGGAGGVSVNDVRAVRDELSRRIDVLEGAVRSLDSTAISEVSTRLHTLAGRLDNAEKRIAQGAAEPTGHAAARLAVAEAVQAAVTSGQPFQKEIAALESLDTPAEWLAPLKRHAQAGVPTPQSLRPGLREGLARAAEAERQARPEAGLWERLSESAASLVHVERVGAGPQQPADLVDAALTRGDAAAALAAWQRLSPAQQQATSEWVTALKTRVEVEEAVTALRRAAVDAFGGNG